MKKSFLTLCIALVSVCSYAQKGTTSAGLYGAFGSENSNFGIGAKVQYGITEALRAEASFDYFFKKDYLTNMNGSLNLHYLIPISDKFRVYPLAGISYVHWKVDAGDILGDMGMGASFEETMKNQGLSQSDLNLLKQHNPAQYEALKAEYESAYKEADDSSSESKIGFNIGAGVEYDLSDKLSIFAEGRYQIVSDFDQCVIAAGLSYKF